ncbi:MAG: phosphodiester glycosidase family protein [Deltaproteobacteria bacterium]|jgi:hypothetical protein|nr:phosphodiester glycosidase family protein [Deltaproteobacteria bacterium]
MPFMKLFFTFRLLPLFYLWAALLPGQARADSRIEPVPDALERWINLAPGLDMLELDLQKSPAGAGRSEIGIAPARSDLSGKQGNFIIIRSDPEKCSYSLHMASEDGQRCSLPERLQKHNLYAAINAGMFLPDNLKNTGFMRNATHVNNGRVVSNFGSFFLAGPRRAGLPQAVILEKTGPEDKLTEKIADYNIVIQNYRLISSAGDILWPESADAYNISALSADKQGRILFIFCGIPLSAADFSRVLLALPLGINLTMYLEGGDQAGLALALEKGNLNGSAGFLFWRGSHDAASSVSAFERTALPNVLGVLPKAE